MFNKKVILQYARSFESFYLYDEGKIIEYSDQLKKDFEGVKFLYSNKCNPNPKVVQTLVEQGFGTDAASVAEVKMSSGFGVPKELIYYSTPGKSMQDIEDTLSLSIIIADSINEVYRIQDVAAAQGITAKIGLRINPDFSFYESSGAPSKFGVDESIVYKNLAVLKTLKNVAIVGIHIHIRSQELRSEIIVKYYDNILIMAQRIQESLGVPMEFINLGSGIGINYSKNDQLLNTSALGRSATDLFNDFKKKMPNVQILIETGRYVVTKCGVYVTRVMDIKESYGTKYIILKNTLNGFFRPSLAQLIGKYSSLENPAGSEPLFTSVDAFDFIALNNETELERVTLVGNLCTATDVVAQNFLMPKLSCGDTIVITNAGSYAAVLSPMQFSSQNPPAQLFLSLDGIVTNTSK